MPAQPAYQDETAKFWNTEADQATPFSRAREDVDDDVSAAVREANDRAAFEREKEASRGTLETLDRIFGSPKAGGEFIIGVHEGLSADAIRTREHLKSEFAKRPPYIELENDAQAKPPDYLDERGRIEWQRYQDVHNAYRSASRETEWRKKMDEAEPFLSRVWRERGGELSKPLDLAAGVIQAATVNPHLVWDKVSNWYGAPATAAAQGEWSAQQAQSAQQYAGISEWFGQVVASQALPGLDHPEVQEKVTDELERMNAAGESAALGMEQKLVNAYSRVVASIRAEHTAQQERAAGEKARHASRSLSGAPSGLGNGPPATDTDTDDDKGNSPWDDARRAYRSMRGMRI